MKHEDKDFTDVSTWKDRIEKPRPHGLGMTIEDFAPLVNRTPQTIRNAIYGRHDANSVTRNRVEAFFRIQGV
jgi:hypothetical protein